MRRNERKKMRIAAAVLCGFFMDLCLGDPDWMPHPVIYMGKAISALEKFLRRRFPDTQKGLLMAGAALAAILPLGSFLMAAAAIYLAGLVHPVLAFLLETLWCWQALAVKGLYTESMRVKKKLEEQQDITVRFYEHVIDRFGREKARELDRLMLELESVLRDELNLMNNQEKGGEADE